MNENDLQLQQQVENTLQHAKEIRAKEIEDAYGEVSSSLAKLKALPRETLTILENKLNKPISALTQEMIFGGMSMATAISNLNTLNVEEFNGYIIKWNSFVDEFNEMKESTNAEVRAAYEEYLKIKEGESSPVMNTPTASF